MIFMHKETGEIILIKWRSEFSSHIAGASKHGLILNSDICDGFSFDFEFIGFI